MITIANSAIKSTEYKDQLKLEEYFLMQSILIMADNQIVVFARQEIFAWQEMLCSHPKTCPQSHSYAYSQ